MPKTGSPLAKGELAINILYPVTVTPQPQRALCPLWEGWRLHISVLLSTHWAPCGFRQQGGKYLLNFKLNKGRRAIKYMTTPVSLIQGGPENNAGSEEAN